MACYFEKVRQGFSTGNVSPRRIVLNRREIQVYNVPRGVESLARPRRGKHACVAPIARARCRWPFSKAREMTGGTELAFVV